MEADKETRQDGRGDREREGVKKRKTGGERERAERDGGEAEREREI